MKMLLITKAETATSGIKPQAVSLFTLTHIVARLLSGAILAFSLLSAQSHPCFSQTLDGSDSVVTQQLEKELRAKQPTWRKIPAVQQLIAIYQADNMQSEIPRLQQMLANYNEAMRIFNKYSPDSDDADRPDFGARYHQACLLTADYYDELGSEYNPDAAWFRNRGGQGFTNQLMKAIVPGW